MRVWRSFLKEWSRQLSRETCLWDDFEREICEKKLLILIVNHCYKFVLEFKRISSSKFQEIFTTKMLELQRRANYSFLIKLKVWNFLVFLLISTLSASLEAYGQENTTHKISLRNLSPWKKKSISKVKLEDGLEVSNCLFSFQFVELTSSLENPLHCGCEEASNSRFEATRL